jgi:hypothetical protein
VPKRPDYSSDERASALGECALILALIAATLIVSTMSLGNKISATEFRVANALAIAAPSTPNAPSTPSTPNANRVPNLPSW